MGDQPNTVFYTVCSIVPNKQQPNGIHVWQRCKKKANFHKRNTLRIQASSSQDKQPSVRQIALKTTTPQISKTLRAKKLFSSNTVLQRENVGKNYGKSAQESENVRSKQLSSTTQIKRHEKDQSPNFRLQMEMEPGLYQFLCKEAPEKTKKNSSNNWFAEFVADDSKGKTEGLSTQDSFQFISEKIPAPNHYTISVNENLKTKNTFGKDKRFKKERPITSNADYGEQREKLIKKSVGNDIDHIRFGTSIKNKKSKVMNVNYCDWYRTHCSVIKDGMSSESFKKGQNMMKYGNSSVERFPETLPKYFGPDYYTQVKTETQKSNVPAYYFLSDVEKGLWIKKQKKQPFKEHLLLIKQNDEQPLKQDKKIKKPFNNLRSKMNSTPNKQNVFGLQNIEKVVNNEVPKNSLGKRRRKYSYPHRLEQEDKIQEKQEDGKHQEIHDRHISKENSWIKKSFNIMYRNLSK